MRFIILLLLLAGFHESETRTKMKCDPYDDVCENEAIEDEGGDSPDWNALAKEAAKLQSAIARRDMHGLEEAATTLFEETPSRNTLYAAGIQMGEAPGVYIGSIEHYILKNGVYPYSVLTTNMEKNVHLLPLRKGLKGIGYIHVTNRKSISGLMEMNYRNSMYYSPRTTQKLMGLTKTVLSVGDIDKEDGCNHAEKVRRKHMKDIDQYAKDFVVMDGDSYCPTQLSNAERVFVVIAEMKKLRMTGKLVDILVERGRLVYDQGKVMRIGDLTGCATCSKVSKSFLANTQLSQ